MSAEAAAEAHDVSSADDPSGQPKEPVEPRSEPGAWKIWARGIGLVVLAIAAFLMGAAILNRAIPPRLPVVTAKQQYFDERRDKYTIVFIGTSTVHRHVIPERFVEELHGQGIEEKAFNYGAPHMTLAEADLIAEQVLSLHPKRLKWVVLDVTLYVDSGKHNSYTPRHIFWHTPFHTFLAVRNDITSGEDRKSTLETVGVDLAAFALNTTGIGRVAEVFRSAWDPSFGTNEEEEEENVVKAEGYRPLEDEGGKGIAERHRRFVASVRSFEHSVVALQAKPAAPRDLPPMAQVIFERIVTRIREAGYEPAFFEPAMLKGSLKPKGDVLGNVPILSFNDPVAYPDLYEPDHHFDAGHLNETGATLLSTYLARQFAERLHDKSGKPEADSDPKKKR